MTYCHARDADNRKKAKKSRYRKKKSRQKKIGKENAEKADYWYETEGKWQQAHSSAMQVMRKRPYCNTKKALRLCETHLTAARKRLFGHTEQAFPHGGNMGFAMQKRCIPLYIKEL